MITEERRRPHQTYSHWLILALLPVLTIIVPALLGHPPILGDNATQNTSFRWLVGQDYRAGHLPTWDPFNWDGTPLLAGFNAGALFPLIVLFVILPANAAMTITLALCWFGAELMVTKIAEAIGISRWFALGAGVVFVGSGAFTAQVVHIDMIEGDLASLVALLCLIRLVETDDRANQMLYALGLAIGFACAVFAGAPEAMLAALVALGVLFVVRLIYRDIGLRIVVLVAIAAALALGIAAPQWIPGLAYTAISNRAHLPASYAGVGPFGYRFLPLIVFPFAYGGYSGGYLPNYFGNFNPSEITIAITSVGLVFALIALSTRRLPTIKPWAKTFLVTLMIVAAVLALGSDTPLAVLIYHLPLFNLQRLASRYIIDVDLAGVLLAAGGAEYYWHHGRLRHLGRVTTLLLELLGLLTLVLGVTIIAAPTFFFQLVDAATIPTGIGLLEIRLYIVLEMIIVWAVLGPMLWHQRITNPSATDRPQTSMSTTLAPTRSAMQIRRILLGALIVDLLGMAVQFVVLPAFYQPAGNPAAPAASALIHGSERYGLYDPNLYLYDRTIVANEQLDRNVFTHTNSIQGYASLSLATYNNITQTKVQSTLDPSLISFYHSQLNMDLLITSRRYFRFPIAHLSLVKRTARPNRPILAARGSSAFFVGNIRNATSLLIDAGPGVHTLGVSATSTSGVTAADPRAHVAADGWIHVTLPPTFNNTLLASVQLRSVHTLTTSRRIDLIVMAGSRRLQVAGPLVNHVDPLEWRAFQGRFSSLDFLSRNPVTGFVRAGPGVTIASQTQATDGTVSVTLTASSSTQLATTLAYAPGWIATTVHGRHLALHNDHGLISIAVPRGTHAIVLGYRAPRTGPSFALGGFSLLVTAILALYAWSTRRRAPINTVTDIVRTPI